jgi:4-alpha-glucanotransferase
MGKTAVEFAGILEESGVLAWQILPLGPTCGISAHSPYSSPSAFAGNFMFIAPDWFIRRGLLDSEYAAGKVFQPSDRTSYDEAYAVKRDFMLRAYLNFRRDEAYKTRFKRISDNFWNFCIREAYWLEDYALFRVLKEMEGQKSWDKWRVSFRDRDWKVLDELKKKPDVARLLDICRFEQFIFFSQLEELREECRERNIALIGDLPIYVGYDSSDVWGHRELFDLDGEGRPVNVAGVPPDYFSETGQRWGNPVYRWDKMREDGYSWWVGRFAHTLRCVDVVRIDHFRGFAGYWQIPSEEPTAVGGEWRPGPGSDFFRALSRKFERMAAGETFLIAEDLGVMTGDVREIMSEFHLPGMKVLHFAFGDGMPQNPYVPHNHRQECVTYAGTHDNNTTVGWWRDEATGEERENFAKYLGADAMSDEDAADAMIRLTLSSTANLAVITVQDILKLGSEARLNRPSTVEGNWTWKLRDFEKLRSAAKDIRDLMKTYGRFVETEREDDAVESGKRPA